MIENFEKILILGGTGFIGSNLVSALIDSGYSPTILTRNVEKTGLPEEIRQKTFLVELDVTNHSLTKAFIEDFRPSLIINSAATHGLEEVSGKSGFKTNYEAAKNLLETALAAEVKRIILFGSADEYGYQPTPQNENLPLKPNSPYAVSKAEMTKLALQMHKRENLPVVILRPFTVYGTAQPKGMFLSDAIRCALEGRLFEMSEGIQTRDYLFIEDFVRAVMQAIQTPDIEGEVFNIGSGNSFPLKEIAAKVWDISGADCSLLKIGARKASVAEMHNTCADITKAKRKLNWQPRVSLVEGLNRTISSIKAQLKT